jgi:hypothetical protein
MLTAVPSIADIKLVHVRRGPIYAFGVAAPVGGGYAPNNSGKTSRMHPLYYKCHFEIDKKPTG